MKNKWELTKNTKKERIYESAKQDFIQIVSMSKKEVKRLIKILDKITE